MGGMMFGMCAAGIGFLVFGIWSLLLIDRYRKAFKLAAEQARSTWAGADATAAQTPSV
jgi:hypothetical protein